MSADLSPMDIFLAKLRDREDIQNFRLYDQNKWMPKRILDVIMEHGLGAQKWKELKPFYEEAENSRNRTASELIGADLPKENKFSEIKHFRYLPEYLKNVYTNSNEDEKLMILCFRDKTGGYRNPVQITIHHDFNVLKEVLDEKFRNMIRTKYNVYLDIASEDNDAQTKIGLWSEYSYALAKAQSHLWKSLKDYQKVKREVFKGNHIVAKWWSNLELEQKSRFNNITNINVTTTVYGDIIFHAFADDHISKLLSFIQKYAEEKEDPLKSQQLKDKMWGVKENSFNTD